MQRYFNVAGPCEPDKHYMLPAASRCGDLSTLIERGLYFVIHAARQSGKTTFLKELERTLRAENHYHVLYCTLETVQGYPNPIEGIPAIVSAIRTAMERTPGLAAYDFAGNRDPKEYTRFVLTSFMDLCQELDKPLIVLFDEADCLTEGTLISFLRQLREGYINRSVAPFIHSLALVGMRNIRDYKAQVRPESQTLGSASPFNIATKTMTLSNFTRDEITSLYAQHTGEIRQAFSEDAIELTHYYTQGQPWLVNSVARECIEEILGNDFTKTVEAAHAREAVERIILRRDTHIDSLLERLKEPRVRRVIEPVIAGGDIEDYFSDDFLYTCDLGLIVEEKGMVRPANPIYAEIIARTLSGNVQNQMPANLIHRWVDADAVRVTELLREFQRFWRVNNQRWRMKIEYNEAYAELVLQAFLQRVLNGGAWIARQFASGSGRVDLCIEYREKRYPIEIKVRRQWSGNLREEGLEQLGEYLDALGETEGWLVTFEQREDLSWDERIVWEDVQANGKTIHIAGV